MQDENTSAAVAVEAACLGGRMRRQETFRDHMCSLCSDGLRLGAIKVFGNNFSQSSGRPARGAGDGTAPHDGARLTKLVARVARHGPVVCPCRWWRRGGLSTASSFSIVRAGRAAFELEDDAERSRAARPCRSRHGVPDAQPAGDARAMLACPRGLLADLEVIDSACAIGRSDLRFAAADPALLVDEVSEAATSARSTAPTTST